MNDLIRPPLYSAWHEVRAVRKMEAGDAQAVLRRRGPGVRERQISWRRTDGSPQPRATCSPSCSAGAYGMVMGSNYNSRPRAVEVLVDGTAAHLVRRREQVAELFALETIPG